MNIDWSKAPEGATHYGPDCDMFEACWYKVDTDGEVFCMLADNDDEFEHVTSLPKNAIERPQEWTGTGLPPVGTVCEGSMPAWGEYRKEWKKCRVIAHENGSAVVIRHETVLGWCDTFRPIRTQEQIEAEEREKAVKVMLDLDPPHDSGFGLTSRKTFCETLYDAGYRKQPKEGA